MMVPRKIAAMSPGPSPRGFTQLHCSARVVTFMAAEEMLSAGIWMMEEEKVDGWDDGYMYRSYAAPLC